MYVQDKVEEYADEIFERLDNGAHIYFCGLKVDAGGRDLNSIVPGTRYYFEVYIYYIL